MWAIAVFLAAIVHLISGTTITPEHKGCYSTNFVNHHSSYYRINQSLTIDQGVAACNHRLTRYMGLQINEEDVDENFVYCGNDLIEVPLKLEDSKCSECFTWEENTTTLYCGRMRMNSMSVYLLRESTPLALLLQTNRGVELLVDNIATISVPYSSSSPNQHIDYIYTDDEVYFVSNESISRSFYNIKEMQYTTPVQIDELATELSGFTVNFFNHGIYCLHKGEFGLDAIISVSSSWDMYSSNDVLRHASIDTYNGILAIVKSPNNTIEVVLTSSIVSDPIADIRNHIENITNIEKIIAVSMDTQERHLYATVNLVGESSTFLVRWDYRVTILDRDGLPFMKEAQFNGTNMRVLLHGQILEGASVLEVFRGNVVWLRDFNNRPTIFMCKLTPTCLFENLTSYSSGQTIYDFTIYHPEKQTPGRKQLCDGAACSHGCQLFSLFTAGCFCPPGMELDSDKSTCINEIQPPKVLTTEATTSTPQANRVENFYATTVRPNTNPSYHDGSIRD